ncbi:hypothetical protein ATO00_09865 [Loigolactobacillus coryniformis subsp. coryniformis]|nr:hypothetical protein ATO00_09865 [Loigolactobacillus coryniformis subsp. coryniformis]
MDILYSIILVLIWLIFLLICKLFNLHFEWTATFLLMFFSFTNLPAILRRKKIDRLSKTLGLSIEEVRDIVNIDKYDLNDWKWDKAYIPQKKLYLLEDSLEKMYLKKFGKEFRTPN